MNDRQKTETAAPARRGRILLVTVVAAVAGAVLTGLLVNIFEHKQEAKDPFFRVVEITDETEDPAVWGKNFPLQYDSYLKRTVDQVRTRFGGSEAVPRTPTAADPRSIVAQSRIEEDPRLKTMWAGYAFAVDFREERGHAYMLDDQTFTERQVVVKQPGTCMHCHGSVYLPYKKLGGGDLIKGFEAMNQMPYTEARKLISHPVACIDCHDPATMQLRITRPGFLEGIRALKASQGVPDYDPNKMATRQEMRSYVCGQCHVEYYFKGPEKRLVYPWANGIKVEQIQAYYDDLGYKDWTHKTSGAPALKAQHPEFEMWSQGIHARSGVACADCHMPYDARRRAQGQRPPRAQPAAQHQQGLPDLPPLAGGGAAGAGRDDPGAHPAAAQPGDGCPGRADRRPRGGGGRRPHGRATRVAPQAPAPGAVPARFRRSRELDRLPRPRRSGADPRGVDQSGAGRPDRRARRRLPAELRQHGHALALSFPGSPGRCPLASSAGCGGARRPDRQRRAGPP